MMVMMMVMMKIMYYMLDEYMNKRINKAELRFCINPQLIGSPSTLRQRLGFDSDKNMQMTPPAPFSQSECK